MSIKNLEAGLKNEDNQKIQQPIALRLNDEYRSFEIDFSVLPGGLSLGNIISSFGGVDGYLPVLDTGTIKVEETGVYNVNWTVQNQDSMTALSNTYRFEFRENFDNPPLSSVSNINVQYVRKSAPISAQEYRYSSCFRTILFEGRQYQLECEHIDGAETLTKNFKVFLQFTRIK